jgi:hypothetical protein
MNNILKEIQAGKYEKQWTQDYAREGTEASTNTSKLIETNPEKPRDRDRSRQAHGRAHARQFRCVQPSDELFYRHHQVSRKRFMLRGHKHLYENRGRN